MNKIFWAFFLAFLGSGLQGRAADFDYYEERNQIGFRQALSYESFSEQDLPIVQNQSTVQAKNLAATRREGLMYGALGVATGAFILGCFASYSCVSEDAYTGLMILGALWGGGSGLIIWGSKHD